MFGAIMLTGGTIVPPVMDETMVEKPPFFFRHHCYEVALDAHWVFVVREVEPYRKAPHMRIDGNTDRSVVQRGNDHIGGFTRDSGNRKELGHRPGNAAAKIVFDEFGGRKNACSCGFVTTSPAYAF